MISGAMSLTSNPMHQQRGIPALQRAASSLVPTAASNDDYDVVQTSGQLEEESSRYQSHQGDEQLAFTGRYPQPHLYQTEHSMDLPPRRRAGTERPMNQLYRENPDFVEEAGYQETPLQHQQQQRSPDDDDDEDDGFDILDQAEVEDGPSADCMMPMSSSTSHEDPAQHKKKKKGLFSTLTSYVASAAKSRSKKQNHK